MFSGRWLHCEIGFGSSGGYYVDFGAGNAFRTLKAAFASFLLRLKLWRTDRRALSPLDHAVGLAASRLGVVGARLLSLS
jgi:hypothetical protein